MSRLVDEAMRAIEGGDPALMNDGFLMLAEIVAVNRIRNFRSDVIPQANGEILEPASLERIQSFVQRWIEEHPPHPSVASAFWVLDKFRDNALRPFLRAWLERYVTMVEPYLHPIGQILVNLDSLGEHAISNGSYSALEYGKNLDDAINYLKKDSANA